MSESAGELRSTRDSPKAAADVSAPAVNSHLVKYAAGEDEPFVDLSTYSNQGYRPGRSWLICVCWYLTSLMVFESGVFPLGWFKAWVLRRFGAKIGRGLVIKPHVRIKYPWRLAIGDHCWVGQGVWIDNLADVSLGNHVCLSQETYICTGSHRISVPTFDLVVKPVRINDGVWLAARSIVLGGVVIGANAVVTAGSVVREAVEPAVIARGNPAQPISKRRGSRISESTDSGS